MTATTTVATPDGEREVDGTEGAFDRQLDDAFGALTASEQAVLDAVLAELAARRAAIRAACVGGAR